MARDDTIRRICMFCGGKADLIEDVSFIKNMAEIRVICPVCHNDFRAFMEQAKWERIKKAEALAQLHKGAEGLAWKLNQ